MKIIIIVPVLLSIFSIAHCDTIGVSAVNTTNGTSLPEEYVVQLKLYLKEEKIPIYIIDILNNSLVQYNVTVRDIMHLTGLNSINLDQTVELVKSFNIPLDKGFSVDSLEAILNITKLPFKDFYTSLNGNLSLSSETVRQALGHLKIDQEKFQSATLFGQDRVIYEVLRNGSYEIDHVTKALDTINKTIYEVFQAARTIVYQHTLRLNSVEFMESLQKIGLNEETSLKLWRNLNMTTNDVYNVEKFRNLLDEKATKLNKDLIIIAVIVGPNKLIIHKSLYDKIASAGEDLKDKTQQYQVTSPPNQRLNDPYKFVTMEFKPSTTKFVNIATNYTLIKNCSYVTIVNDKVTEQGVEVEGNTTDHGIVVKKNTTTVYNVGSPLICNNLLYGLARQDNSYRIIFDSFQENHTIMVPLNSSINGTFYNGTVIQPVGSGSNILHFQFLCTAWLVLTVFVIQ